ncbi:MAG: helix-turn-helix domain-containing protein [Xenococcus sp. (in: cyanobacteria)]
MSFIGTTEAAYLLGICHQRVRQLLSEGRIKGAEKVGRFWQIPLFQGMPKIINGNRGPKGTWRKRRQQAHNFVCVNQHKIKKNKAKGNIQEKVILVKRGKNKTTSECHYLEIKGPARLVYQPYDPLNCGATVWLEVAPEVPLVTKDFSDLSELILHNC